MNAKASSATSGAVLWRSQASGILVGCQGEVGRALFLSLAGVAAPALMLGEREETKAGLVPVAGIKYLWFVGNLFLICCISQHSAPQQILECWY
jgi:hypothetical protein